MQHENKDWLHQFEPVGRNCEFGFVLRHFGSDRPSLFRWTWLGANDFCRLLEQDFEDAFALENVRPHIDNKKMVMDAKYKWYFHSALHSDDNKQFLLSGERLEKLHRIEMIKIQREIEIFLQRIRTEGVVCVYAAVSVSDEEAKAILRAIDAKAGGPLNRLLVVDEAGASGREPGQTEDIAPRIARGSVSYMAPVSQSYAADFENWEKILNRYRAPAPVS
jgi:hypothetical protein